MMDDYNFIDGEITEEATYNNMKTLESLLVLATAQLWELGPELMALIRSLFKVYCQDNLEKSTEHLIHLYDNDLKIAKIIVNKAETDGRIDAKSADDVRYMIDTFLKRRSCDRDEAFFNGNSGRLILKVIKKADFSSKMGDKSAFKGLNDNVKNIAKVSDRIIEIYRESIQEALNMTKGIIHECDYDRL